MPENKTKSTEASVEDYLASRASAQQHADCLQLIELHAKVTGHTAKMWGPSIVGFGSYRYTYPSGRSGEAPLAGFAIRGRELVVYLDCEEPSRESLLSKLGKHRVTKSCLYFTRLADLDLAVLERLVTEAVAATRQRYS